MATERLTDQHRRVLTELIGECWHELDVKEIGYSGSTSPAVCKICGKYFTVDKCTWKDNPSYINRTFTTWNDYGDCIEAIKGKGLLQDFYNYCYERNFHTQDFSSAFSPLGICYHTNFITYLFNPDRLLETADWWMERRK